jgi:hypothetical protein
MAPVIRGSAAVPNDRRAFLQVVKDRTIGHSVVLAAFPVRAACRARRRSTSARDPWFALLERPLLMT